MKKQTTSDIAHVGLGREEEKKTETTSDRAQVELTSGLSKIFTRPTQNTEVLKPQVNIYQSRTILGKEGRDKTGLGCSEEKRINNSPVDHSSLVKPDVGITS